MEQMLLITQGHAQTPTDAKSQGDLKQNKNGHVIYTRGIKTSR